MLSPSTGPRINSAKRLLLTEDKADSSASPLNDIQVSRADLKFDVRQLHELIDRAGKDAAYQGRFQLNLGVGIKT